MTENDPLSAALDAVRDLIGARDALVRQETIGVREFAAAEGRLADRVPRLLAALDAVLAVEARWQENLSRLYERAGQLGDPRMTTDILAEARRLEQCGEELRSAVSAALAGKGENGA